MLKKVCLDLLTILLPLILILTPHPIFAQDIMPNYSQQQIDTSVNTRTDGLRDAIRYWWIAPLALIPLLFFLWPREEERSRPAYRRATVYQSVSKSRSKRSKTNTLKKRARKRV